MKSVLLLVAASIFSLSAMATEKSHDEQTKGPIGCLQKTKLGDYSSDNGCMSKLLEQSVQMREYKAGFNYKVSEQGEMDIATLLFYPEKMEIVVVGHRS